MSAVAAATRLGRTIAVVGGAALAVPAVGVVLGSSSGGITTPADERELGPAPGP